MNAHARLDLRHPRLVGAMMREMAPFFRELSKDQCSAVAPLTVMAVFSDDARVQYLSRCAELNMGLPVRMTQPAVLKQFRLLEDCLRLDYHPTNLPGQVQVWLQNLKMESEAARACTQGQTYIKKQNKNSVFWELAWIIYIESKPLNEDI